MTLTPEQIADIASEEEGRSRYRQYQGPMAILTMVVAAGMALFSLLYVSGFLPSVGIYFQRIQYNAIFMSGIIILAFLLNPARKGDKRGRLPWYDSLLIMGGLTGSIYIIVNAREIEAMAPLLASPMETVLGFISIVVLLEAVRRLLGWPMIIISLIFILYSKISYLLPGILGAYEQTWPRIMAEAYLSPSGIFGGLTSLASGMIVAFIAFGVFFIKVGGGQIFLDLALALTGHIRGGPAKAAIIGSAMFGTLSGSPAANVAVTGTITIPLMKKTGFSSVFAGAVETVASTGGCIVPPVMGAVAFVMADMLRVNYATIAMAAILPAVLYFTALFVQTHLRAVKDGLKGIPRSELPSFWATVKGGWEFAIPLGTLIYLLFVLRYPPAVCASYAIVALIVVSLFRKRTRLSVNGFIECLAESFRSMLMVAPVIAAAGIILATLSQTGLGPKLATSLVTALGHNRELLVLASGLACYVSGMGVSIIVTYVLLAVLVAPALVEVGIPLMASHFFIFYMGLTMFITPPSAPTAFVASAISGASPYRTGFQSMRLGIVTFLVPFILIYNPALILLGTPAEIIQAAVTAVIGVFAISIGIEGYLFTPANWPQRIIALVAGLALMWPVLVWRANTIGIGLLALLILWQWLSKKSQSPAILEQPGLL